MNINRERALLVLADGMCFEGFSFGAPGETIGEVVFNTSMTGYQEIITDASYKGQLVVMTYTQIGNYGVNAADSESPGPQVEGFVVKEYVDFPSNWRSDESLGRYLKANNIVGIEGVDTRALTRHLRDRGVQMGIISTLDLDPHSLKEKVRQHPGISSVDLVRVVSAGEPFTWNQVTWKWQKRDGACGELADAAALRAVTRGRRPGKGQGKNIIVYDFGVKLNILRHLAETGCSLSVVPAGTPAEGVLEQADGIVLSNGPGDPQTVRYAVDNIKKMLGKKPILGICLGHQLLGLALGGRTYKLKFGHHGGNHPVMDLSSGKVEITSQNHNYCVDIESLNGQVELTHKNLYDGTEEGMRHRDQPIMSIQYHPEAGPGPNDSCYLFGRFVEMLGND